MTEAKRERVLLPLDEFSPVFHRMMEYFDDASVFVMRRVSKSTLAACREFVMRDRLPEILIQRFERATRRDNIKPIRKFMIFASCGVNASSKLLGMTDLRQVIGNRRCMFALAITIRSPLALFRYLSDAQINLKLEQSFVDVVDATVALFQARAKYDAPDVWSLISSPVKALLYKNPDAFWALAIHMSELFDMPIWTVITILANYMPDPDYLYPLTGYDTACITSLAALIARPDKYAVQKLTFEVAVHNILPGWCDADTKQGEIYDFICRICVDKISMSASSA